MKILNLYAGIGGNRKLWEDVEVTAVEINPDVAKVYSDHFPHDKIVVGDAHEYLLENYENYDFVWTSPPCPTHSQMGRLRVLNNSKNTGAHLSKAKYPDMKLYQEILLLQHYFKGKFCVENVEAFYNPLIEPTKIGRHWFWVNFKIPHSIDVAPSKIENGKIKEWEEKLGYDLSEYVGFNKRLALRNCVDPDVGLHILNCARNIITKSNTKQGELFV
ncbi:DNA cytosine methyltransferase [Ekhidna sp.]